MKKNGFTLAEVLITLAIIGVVATLTLPALMSNTQEQQAITGFRKAMNTLNEVAQMNAAVNGFDFSGLKESQAPSATAQIYDANGALKQTVWALVSANARTDATASARGGIGGGCQSKNQIFFQDGTVLCYNDTNVAGTNVYIEAYVDTNGVKAPNQISTCTQSTCKNSERTIKDQFRITLHGASAIPGKVTYSETSGITEDTSGESYAARWAMIK